MGNVGKERKVGDIESLTHRRRLWPDGREGVRVNARA